MSAVVERDGGGGGGGGVAEATNILLISSHCVTTPLSVISSLYNCLEKPKLYHKFCWFLVGFRTL